MICLVDCDIENIAIHGGSEITKTKKGFNKLENGGAGKGIGERWMLGKNKFSHVKKKYARYPVNGSYGSWFDVRHCFNDKYFSRYIYSIK